MRGWSGQHGGCEQAGITHQTVGKWRQRFLELGLDGLLDESRPGAPRQVTEAQVERVVRPTLESTLADATYWSTRAMAKRCGLSQTMVTGIWRTFALQPHLVEGFKLSKDPLSVDKVRDIVGLYLNPNPPDRALVLCVDDKAQIQALYRSQQVPPMLPGQAERRTSDYQRYGTSNLFAALDFKSGTVIGEFHHRHRAREFRKFLQTIDERVPHALDLHLILDNYGTHKTPAIKTLAFASSALSSAFHPHRRFLAQPGRTLVRALD
jgi:Homeodomain-like domain/DDE superfamily endonuclease